MKIEVEIENGNRGNLPLHLNYTTIIQISKTISKWKILNPTSSPKEVDNSAIYIHYMLSKRKSCQTYSRLSNHERKKGQKDRYFRLSSKRQVIPSLFKPI